MPVATPDRDRVTVQQLWRYPVKSLLGEQPAALDVDARGARGDRLFALRDPHGKLGSGKDTRRFRRVDGLFGLQSRYRDDLPEIVFPDGTVRPGLDPQTDAALSRLLGTPLSVAREDSVVHFDSAPLHLLTTATLRTLQAAMPELRLDARRFRPNLVLDASGEGQPERAWVGRRLRIGDEVELYVRETTERCRMTTLAQQELPEQPRILRGLARHAGLHVGVYAEVHRPGRIAVGDTVRLLQDES